MTSDKTYTVAKVQGMCGGVFGALAKIERALAASSCGVWVFHELVHNRSVTEKLRAQGVHFADTPEEIPQGSSIVIGAHGVSAEVEELLRSRASTLTDATCPLVKKLHNAAQSLTPADELVLFGRSGHPEVTGVAGHSRAGKNFIVSSLAEIDALPELLHPFFLAQTTVDHTQAAEAETYLRRKYPALRFLSGVCDASFQRQNAVVGLAKLCELILVIGSAHSSNANRLRELAEKEGCFALLIDGAADLPMERIETVHFIGITSGASTPKESVDQVIAALERNGFTSTQA